MREIVLDTETTGLDPDAGDRIVEIGAVEIVNHMPTGRSFHRYINPQRDVPPEAVEVHGLTAAFLSDKPVFRAIAAEFAEFIGDARLVIHNAAFDMKFLNAELGWAGQHRPCLGPGGRHARPRPPSLPGRQQHPRRALPAIWRRQYRPAEARRPARLGTAGRGLSGADGRPAAGSRAERRLPSGPGIVGIWVPPARASAAPAASQRRGAAAHAAFVAELEQRRFGPASESIFRAYDLVNAEDVFFPNQIVDLSARSEQKLALTLEPGRSPARPADGPARLGRATGSRPARGSAADSPRPG